MKYQKIKKIANVDLYAKFIKGWKDSQDNILAVFDVSGKKYSLIKPNNTNDWHYWMGIGSEKITAEMPAGRGDYFVSESLDPKLSSYFSEIIASGARLELLSTVGASWSPENQSQLESLARLVDDSGKINQYLSDNGLIYTGTDRIIFGENITGNDLLRNKAKSKITTQKPEERKVKEENKVENKVERPESIQNKSSSLFGGVAPVWISNSKGHGYEIGPRHHSERPGRAKRFENWQSNNAWDVLGDAGTMIYSLTNGTVKYVKETSDSATNVFGVSISVSGTDGYPDVFYTHTANPFVKPGDRVEVGSPIAQIGVPKTEKMPKHVHIGLPFGNHISSLMSQNGDFKLK